MEENAVTKATRNRPGDDLNNRIFFRVFQLGNTLQRQAITELGVTTVQWAVLGAALSRPKFVQQGVLVGELADYLVVSRQSLDGVLKRLEREGHVERVIDPTDRRARQVRLTEKGIKFWTALQKKIYEFYDQAVSSFSFDERVSIAHYLNILQREVTTVKNEE